MTIDSEVTEAEKIENITKRGTNIRRGLTISLLVHTFFVWAALGFPTISFSNWKKETKKAPISVSLHQDYESLNPEKGFKNYSSEEELEFGRITSNPKATLESQTQIYIQKEVGTLTDLTDLEFKIMKFYTRLELQKKGNKDIQRMLEETYLAFKKTQLGESNESTYYKFFQSYVNVHYLFNVAWNREIYQEYMAILPILIKNQLLRHTTLHNVRFNRDGTWEVVRFEIMPGFIDENGKVSRFHRKLLDRIPKTFIAPEVAGLPIPFEAMYWFRNPYYLR